MLSDDPAILCFDRLKHQPTPLPRTAEPTSLNIQDIPCNVLPQDLKPMCNSSPVSFPYHRGLPRLTKNTYNFPSRAYYPRLEILGGRECHALSSSPSQKTVEQNQHRDWSGGRSGLRGSLCRLWMNLPRNLYCFLSVPPILHFALPMV